MGKVKKNKEQVLVAVLVPVSWKDSLLNLAKKESEKLGHRVTYIDLIRAATEKKYNLEHWENGQLLKKELPVVTPKKTLIRK
jgi:hypothetical protein